MLSKFAKIEASKVEPKKHVPNILGSSNKCKDERELNDLYSTNPIIVQMLIDMETPFYNVLEPSCGLGHISKKLIENGVDVTSHDLIDYGWEDAITGQNFLHRTEKWDGDIITNPPFKYVDAFLTNAMEIIPDGRRVAFFMRTLFLEGKKRKILLEKYPIKTVYVSSSRVTCAKGGDDSLFNTSGIMCYSWFVWEKGYTGKTELKLFN